MEVANTAETATTRVHRRTNVQKAALAVGAVFLLDGVLGFVPGITSQYDQLSFAGHENELWVNEYPGVGHRELVVGTLPVMQIVTPHR
jgi:hypothetical protein